MLLATAILFALHDSALARPAVPVQDALVQDGTPAPPVALPQPAKDDTIIARVQGSFLHLAIDIPGFTTEDRNAAILRRIFGDRGVLIGAIPSKLASVEILSEKDAKGPTTDEAWRDENLRDSGTRWNLFDGGGASCGELSMLLDGSGSHEFHAFFVRGGYRFDLHASESLTNEHKGVFTREAFSRMVESVRFAVVRRGTWDQMPETAIDLMNAAIQHKLDWKELLKKRAETAPGDYAVWFATGEVARHFGTPPGDQIPAYRRAIELLDGILASKKSLSAKERLALAASEDGFALALLDSGDPEKAIPHLERGLEIAHDLTAPTRAGLTYNLACAHARLGQVEIAVARLLESENLQPGTIGRAGLDKDFDKIRESKRFQDLMHGDRGNH